MFSTPPVETKCSRSASLTHERQPIGRVVDGAQHGGERPHFVARVILLAANEPVADLAGTQMLLERRDEVGRHLAHEDRHVARPRGSGGLEARVVDVPRRDARHIVDEGGNHLGHDVAPGTEPRVVGHLLGRHGEGNGARAVRVHFVAVGLEVDGRWI
jgi:hypothetical protein